jgi:hypothetical protein
VLVLVLVLVLGLVLGQPARQELGQPEPELPKLERPEPEVIQTTRRTADGESVANQSTAARAQSARTRWQKSARPVVRTPRERHRTGRWVQVPPAEEEVRTQNRIGPNRGEL